MSVNGRSLRLAESERSVAANTRDVDSQRLAVLAALHIADELQALELRYNALAESVQKLDKRSNDLSRLLDGELELRNAS